MTQVGGCRSQISNLSFQIDEGENKSPSGVILPLDFFRFSIFNLHFAISNPFSFQGAAQ